MTLTAGDKAPVFKGIDQDGNSISLKDFAGKKVVLYFYPKDNTPGCTKQACDLRDNYKALLKAGYVVIGVSTDSEKSHQKFIKKFELPFPLIADEDKTIHEQYGVWGEKSMYGKTYMGTLRTTFVIDEKGKIEEVISKVKTDDHTAQILNRKSIIMSEYTELNKVASQVRRDIVRMVHGAKGGHPGGALGCTDLLVLLYFKMMKHDKNFKMDGIGEDIFYLSNGHISAVLYSVLARSGYFPVAELVTHRKINSRLQGHPTPHSHLPGVRMASGSLGQGLSVGCGTAQAKKLNKDDRFVYVLMGDGEQQEGQVWEAAMYAPNTKLDNLIGFVDYNGQQIDGPCDKVMSLRDLGAKYKAFGWNVLSCNGHDFADLEQTILKAQANKGTGVPTMILMKSEMGAGVDYMMGSHKWHGAAPNDAELASALNQLLETDGDY